MVGGTVPVLVPFRAPEPAPTPGVARSQAGPDRNLGLDIARAAAITLVFASHTVVDLVGPVGVTMLQWGGKAGVELFFSLSGFLIGQILIRMAESGISPRAVGGFLFRRWLRTLPLYYATLVVGGWFFGIQNPHAYLLLQNFYPAEPRVIVVSWSLVLEEYFYLFFPLAMLPLAALLGRGTRLVATVAAALIVVCVTGAIVNAYRFDPIPMAEAVENPFFRMDCAAYGVLAACLLRASPRAVVWARDRARRITLLSIVAIIAWASLYVTAVHTDVATMVGWGMLTWGKPYFALELTVQDVAFAVTVLGLYLMRPIMPRWVAWCIRQVSLLSYSIYLMHTLVMVLLGYYAPWLTTGALKLFATAVLTIALSTLTYHLIERPVLALRDSLVPGKRSAGNTGFR